uniref:Putative retrotransposon protein n=1 Tax=Oryza sativa subsp. japonica TaxID=39947 RepID=Q6UUR6_ORYSJ|nr:putative retrotransposon protein [Oryza sativa Japonica Group]
MAEERESFESQWVPSDVTEDNLKEMVAHGVLPAKEIIGWRPSFGEAFPTPDTREIVVFAHFFYGGFSLPTSRFFRGILNFYGISLHHLNPNSIVHIANFIHACEAFLGIRPHFTLFRRSFFLKPQPNKSKPCVVGGAGFQLRGTISQKYFSMPFKTSNKGWHANWFYVQNPEPALPEYSCLPPVYRDTWNSLSTGDEAAQAIELMERMIKLKEQVNNEGYYTQEFALMKSDPPIAQRRSPHHQTGQGSGRPRIRSETQPSTSDPIGQSDSRKRKLVLSDDEADDTARKPGDRETTKKLPKQATPRKKTSSRPVPKIRKSSRKPSDIDPSGKDSDPTNVDTSSSKETGPTAKDHPSDNQPATDNVDSVNTLGPMIGDEEEIPRIRAAKDSCPPILVKWWDDNLQPQGIVINRQKEDEEVCLLKKALNQATRIVNRIHLRNEAKTATLERLVPHLGTLEATRSQLHEARELAKNNEHDLRDRIAELQESNFELSGSSNVNVVQAAKISQLEKQIQTLENDKAELARQRDSALKEVEDRKIKSQAQFDVLVDKINKLEGARDKVANAATPLIQAMFFNNTGSSTLDATEIFDKLRVAPDTYFRNIKEAGSMGASLALAMTKSIYPRVDMDAIDGFVDGTSEEVALDLISDAQKAANKIAADVVERFQDVDLRPTGSDKSDDEKTDTD